MNKQKKIIIVLLILSVLLTIIGGTLSYLIWSTNANQTTNVTFTVTPDFSCSADAGGNITSNDIMLAPTDCMDPEYAIQRTITTSTTTTGNKVISMDLWLNVNSVSTNLLNSNNFKYAITKNKNSCTSGVINSGIINQDISNNKINLLEGAEYATLTDTYYLYIWLDEAETNHNTMNQSFNFSIGGQCTYNGLEKATMVDLDGTSSYYKEDDYKTKITEIHFVYDDDLPSGVIQNQVSGKDPYQLSTDASRPIYGYLNQIGNTDTYKLYITSPYKIYAGSLKQAFNGMTALTSIIFDNFDTSATTNMIAMFSGCSNLTSVNVSNFNTSNVTDVRGMFNSCTSLTRLDLGNFDTSKVSGNSGSTITGMRVMFNNCSSLTDLDVSSFDTSKVTIMASMFSNCTSLTHLDLSNFDTSNVTDMSSMFRNCSGLTTLYLTNFNTSNVTTMTYMFYGCSSLTTLDLSNFNIANVTDVHSMFYGCSSLTTLDLSGFDTSSITSMHFMFYDCPNLIYIYVSELWDVSGLSENSGAEVFTGDINLPNYNSSYVTKTKAHYGPGGYLTYKAHN